MLRPLVITGIFAAASGFFVGSFWPSVPPADKGGGAGDGNVRVEAPVRWEVQDDDREIRPEVAEAMAESQSLADSGDLFGALRSAISIKDDVLRGQSVLALIGSFDAEQMATLTQRLMAEEGQSDEDRRLFGELADSDLALIALLDRWAEIDPGGIEDHLLSMQAAPGRGSWKNMRALTVMLLAFHDPQRASALVEKLQANTTGDEDKKGEYIARLREFLAAGIASTDPAGAIRRLREEGTDFAKFNFFDGLFNASGLRIGEMFDEGMQLPAGEARKKFLNQLFSAWGEKDPSAALLQADSLGEADGRVTALEGVIENLAKIDPQTGCEYLASLPAGGERDQLAHKFVSEWIAAGDPMAALIWAGANLPSADYLKAVEKGSAILPPEMGRELISAMGEDQRAKLFESTDTLSNFLSGSAESDALGTLNWLRELGAIMPDLGGSFDFGQKAARQDLAAALAVAEELPAGRFRERFLEGLAMFAGRTEAEEALQWTNQLQPEEKEAATALILEGWALEDPLRAAEFARAENGVALKTVVDGWAQRDAEGAYRWLLESEQGDPEALAAHLDNTALLDSWIRQDAAGAAEAMAGFPGDLAPARVAGVIERWASEEPRRASEFVAEKLAGGPVRDAAVLALIGQIQHSDQAAARVWAESIADPEMKKSARELLAPE